LRIQNGDNMKAAFLPPFFVAMTFAGREAVAKARTRSDFSHPF
jgi:hypothetical protein